MRATLILTTALLPEGMFPAGDGVGFYNNAHLLGVLASGQHVYHLAPGTPIPPEAAEVLIDGAAGAWTWDDPRVPADVLALGIHSWSGDD